MNKGEQLEIVGYALSTRIDVPLGTRIIDVGNTTSGVPVVWVMIIPQRVRWDQRETLEFYLLEERIQIVNPPPGKYFGKVQANGKDLFVFHGNSRQHSTRMRV
jgi:hypothetical protein